MKKTFFFALNNIKCEHIMSIPTALNFLENYKQHKKFSQKELDKLNTLYLHERVFITISCPDIYQRKKTAGVITNIAGTLSNYFRFTIVTEEGKELILRQEHNKNKGIIEGAIMDVKIEVM